jgi:hypothetical protein
MIFSENRFPLFRIMLPIQQRRRRLAHPSANLAPRAAKIKRQNRWFERYLKTESGMTFLRIVIPLYLFV